MLKPPRFNAYYDIKQVQPVDGAHWKLELSGLIADKRPWNTQQIAALPEREMIIRHICVEGWDYIGQWSGVPLGLFLKRIGADLTAKYIGFKCADNYTSSIDMKTALHPQTLLATKYAGEPIGRPVRISPAPAHIDQAGVQESQVDHGHGGDQHLSRRLFREPGLSTGSAVFEPRKILAASFDKARPSPL